MGANRLFDPEMEVQDRFSNLLGRVTFCTARGASSRWLLDKSQTKPKVHNCPLTEDQLSERQGNFGT